MNLNDYLHNPTVLRTNTGVRVTHIGPDDRGSNEVTFAEPVANPQGLTDHTWWFTTEGKYFGDEEKGPYLEHHFVGRATRSGAKVVRVEYVADSPDNVRCFFDRRVNDYYDWLYTPEGKRLVDKFDKFDKDTELLLTTTVPVWLTPSNTLDLSGEGTKYDVTIVDGEIVGISKALPVIETRTVYVDGALNLWMSPGSGRVPFTVTLTDGVPTSFESLPQ